MLYMGASEKYRFIEHFKKIQCTHIFENFVKWVDQSKIWLWLFTGAIPANRIVHLKNSYCTWKYINILCALANLFASVNSHGQILTERDIYIYSSLQLNVSRMNHLSEQIKQVFFYWQHRTNAGTRLHLRQRPNLMLWKWTFGCISWPFNELTTHAICWHGYISGTI